MGQSETKDDHRHPIHVQAAGTPGLFNADILIG
jgi:hypothetical protein